MNFSPINLLLLSVLLTGLVGCSAVAPWQRGILAKPSMALNSKTTLNNLNAHVHGSREAASGGGATSGGGCGCY